MADTETLRREAGSIEVLSSAGAGEAVLLEDLGGMVLLSVDGRGPKPTEEQPDPLVSTSLERDTWKIDIAEWLEETATTAPDIDVREVTERTFGIIDLLDQYRTGKQEVSELEYHRDRLMRPSTQQARARQGAKKIINQYIEEHGREAILRIPNLIEEILDRAEEQTDSTPAEIEAEIKALEITADEKAQEVEEEVGSKLEAFKASGDTLTSKLIAPVRSLVWNEMLEPNGDLEGLAERWVTLGRGPVAQKMSIAVPRPLNAQRIPMTAHDVRELASRIRKEANNKPSIWS